MTANLLGVNTSELARDEDLVVKGQIAAYDHYRHDMVSVGVDIYNIEESSRCHINRLAIATTACCDCGLPG